MLIKFTRTLGGNQDSKTLKNVKGRNSSDVQIGVSENGGTPKSSILIGFSIINHPFWGTPIFGNTQIGPQLQEIFSHVFFASPTLPAHASPFPPMTTLAARAASWST